MGTGPREEKKWRGEMLGGLGTRTAAAVEV
jgi:hypothetical protein